MGCGASSETAENAKITKAQNHAAKQQNATVKLLLLGTGDSGKTTLRKQVSSNRAATEGTTIRRRSPPRSPSAPSARVESIR